MYAQIPDNKPISDDERSHFYQGQDGIWYEQHIENLFEDCFHGRDIDEIFQHNFREYFTMLTGHTSSVPDGIFTDKLECYQWIATHFGLLSITSIAEPSSAEYAHCRYVAKLRTPVSEPTPCLAPTELHAALLAVVYVFRTIASGPINERMGPKREHAHN